MLLTLFIFSILFFPSADSYYPVVLMHGIIDGPETMDTLRYEIEHLHPGTKVYEIDLFNDGYSLYNMWYQIEVIRKRLQEIMSTSNETHFLGFSQGGIIGRALIQTTNNHNINTFIALSSPLSGEYGIPIVYSNLFPNFTLEMLTDFFYTEEGQWFSLAGYWHDPYNAKRYQQENMFLSNLTYPTNPDWKQNFLKLERMVMIGGKDDRVVIPWQSSHFGFYDDKLGIVEMEDQDFYIHDTFGLRTLNEQNKLKTFSIPGIFHTHWHENRAIIQKYIIPYLT